MFGSQGPAERLIRSVPSRLPEAMGDGVGHRDIETRAYAE
jgi:hypothetical protein